MMYGSKNIKKYSTGGMVSRLISNKPPPFMDMSAPDYVGIPPLPKFQQGGSIVAQIEKNLKRNKFQR